MISPIKHTFDPQGLLPGGLLTVLTGFRQVSISWLCDTGCSSSIDDARRHRGYTRESTPRGLSGSRRGGLYNQVSRWCGWYCSLAHGNTMGNSGGWAPTRTRGMVLSVNWGNTSRCSGIWKSARLRSSGAWLRVRSCSCAWLGFCGCLRVRLTREWPSAKVDRVRGMARGWISHILRARGLVITNMNRIIASVRPNRRARGWIDDRLRPNARTSNVK